jgi:hypothetical protein
METVFLSGIRCFPEVQTFTLRPITILVGENSTGKSTLLAATRIAWDIAHGGLPVDFNEEPFRMGTFDSIASYVSAKEGRSDSFTIGFTHKIHPDIRKQHPQLPATLTISGTFVKGLTQPRLASWRLSAPPYDVEAEPGSSPTSDETKSTTVHITAPTGSLTLRMPALMTMTGLSNIFQVFAFLLSATEDQGTQPPDSRIQGQLADPQDRVVLNAIALDAYSSRGSRPFAFAPIRTTPQRTYDPIHDLATPEGAHVPVIMANMKTTSPGEWDELMGMLAGYGKQSGLFKEVDVRRLGGRPSDPFQLRIRVIGPSVNVVDVGYGVNQILPILVDAMRMPSRATLLLQQPEVHLHPKAQAELGEYLAYIAVKHNKRFVIETHSDHLVDRVRTLVRDRDELSPDHVGLYFLQWEGRQVRVTEIPLDSRGDPLATPPGYRQFFLDEERRLLGA